jgi:hypothetical protein
MDSECLMYESLETEVQYCSPNQTEDRIDWSPNDNCLNVAEVRMGLKFEYLESE